MGKSSTEAFIFLNGHYLRYDKTLLSGILKRRRHRPLFIAVDGGLSFLQKINSLPDFWLTDLDSAPRIKKNFLNKTEILLYPSDKDKTDAELTLDFCARRGIKKAVIWGWYDNRHETDHLLGNLMLSRLLLDRFGGMNIHFINSRQEIYPLSDEKLIVKGKKGWRLGIVPLSRSICLTLKGTAFKAENLKVNAGDTISLRNQITAQTCSVNLEGLALLILGRQ